MESLEGLFREVLKRDDEKMRISQVNSQLDKPKIFGPKTGFHDCYYQNHDGGNFKDETEWRETLLLMLKECNFEGQHRLKEFMPGALYERLDPRDKPLVPVFKEFKKGDPIIQRHQQGRETASQDGVIVERGGMLELIYYDERRRDRNGKCNRIAQRPIIEMPLGSIPIRNSYFPPTKSEEVAAWTKDVALPIIANQHRLGLNQDEKCKYYDHFWPLSTFVRLKPQLIDDVVLMDSLSVGRIHEAGSCLVVLRKEGDFTFPLVCMVTFVDEEVLKTGLVVKGKPFCEVVLFTHQKEEFVKDLLALEKYVPGIMKAVPLIPREQALPVPTLRNYYLGCDSGFKGTQMEWLYRVLYPILGSFYQAGVPITRKDFDARAKVFFPNALLITDGTNPKQVVTKVYANPFELVRYGEKIIEFDGLEFIAPSTTIVITIGKVGSRGSYASPLLQAISFGLPVAADPRKIESTVKQMQDFLKIFMEKRIPFRLNYHPIGLKETDELDRWYCKLVEPMVKLCSSFCKEECEKILNCFFPESSWFNVVWKGKQQPCKKFLTKRYFRPGELTRFNSRLKANPGFLINFHCEKANLLKKLLPSKVGVDYLMLSPNHQNTIQNLENIDSFMCGRPAWFEAEQIALCKNDYAEFRRGEKEQVVAKKESKPEVDSSLIVKTMPSKKKTQEREVTKTVKTKRLISSTLSTNSVPVVDELDLLESIRKKYTHLKTLSLSGFKHIGVGSPARHRCLVGPFHIKAPQVCAPDKTICKLSDLETGEFKCVKSDRHMLIYETLSEDQLSAMPGQVLFRAIVVDDNDK